LARHVISRNAAKCPLLGEKRTQNLSGLEIASYILSRLNRCGVAERGGLGGAFLSIRKNIEHCRAMLKITTDPERRQVLEKLLLDAQAKLKKDEAAHKTK
jgi:hypothetical protein